MTDEIKTNQHQGDSAEAVELAASQVRLLQIFAERVADGLKAEMHADQS